MFACNIFDAMRCDPMQCDAMRCDARLLPSARDRLKRRSPVSTTASWCRIPVTVNRWRAAFVALTRPDRCCRGVTGEGRWSGGSARESDPAGTSATRSRCDHCRLATVSSVRCRIQPHELQAATKGAAQAFRSSVACPNSGMPTYRKRFRPSRRSNRPNPAGVQRIHGSCALPVVMHSVLSQQDSMSKKPEPGSAVHLPFQELRFRVDALARAVGVGQGESGDRGVVVLVQAPQEGFELW